MVNPAPQASSNLAAAPDPEVVARPRLDPVAIGLRVEGIAPWRQELSNRVVNSLVGSLRLVAIRFFWLLNGLNGVLFGLAFAAPLLAWLGAGWLYQQVFRACHLLCVQDHEHSFTLFGYQMPFCERCLALYGSMFAGGIAYQIGRTQPQIFRPKLRRLPFWGMLVACLPIAIDGFSQMWGWRQSNWELRLLTGAIFGSGVVWYLYPQIADKLQSLKKLVARDSL